MSSIPLPSHQMDDETDGQMKVFEAVRGGVEVKTRSYRLTKYKNCFLGRDLVTWILEHSDITGAVSREDALEIGRGWQSDYKLFHHVCYDHDLKDEKLFYRFREERKLSRRCSIAAGMQKLTKGTSEWEPVKLNIGDVNAFLTSLDFGQVARCMLWGETPVEIKDRTYHLKPYKQCFVGSEACDWMETNLFVTRQQAVAIGQQLLVEQYFRHSAGMRPFEDTYFFYTTKNCVQAPIGLGNVFGKTLKSITEELEVKEQQHRCTPMMGGLVPNLVAACVRKLHRPEIKACPTLFLESPHEAAMQRLYTLLDCSADGGLYLVGHLGGFNEGLACCALLKHFLFQTVEPLLTHRLFEYWVTLAEAMRSGKGDSKVRKLLEKAAALKAEDKERQSMEGSSRLRPDLSEMSLVNRLGSLLDTGKDMTEDEVSDPEDGEEADVEDEEDSRLSEAEELYLSACQALLSGLPSPNRALLLVIVTMASSIAKQGHVSAKKIAYSLSPTLLWAKAGNSDDMKKAERVSHVVEFMIRHCNLLGFDL